MFIIKKWFGGVVDPAQCWVNTWGDANFHEWGSLPAGGFQTGCECRISYTPDADCSVILLAAPKQRFGNVQSYQVFNRAYGKARIVQVAPTYKNDFANYNEGLIELDASYPIVRFLDPTMPLMAVAALQAGVESVFTVEHLGGDAHPSEVDFGCLFMMFGPFTEIAG